MRSRRRAARIAGLWYLGMALSGPIGIVYAPGKILAAGDAGTTAANIVAHAQLVRVGVAASLFCQFCFVFLALALRRLFEGVNDRNARLMVALVIAGVPIAVVNELFPLAALELAGGGASLNAIAPVERSALALLLMDLHGRGISFAGFFWGLWLLPFAALVIQSRFIPRIFGVLLIVGGLCYLFESAVAVLAPGHLGAVSNVVALPMAVSELSMVLWLLIKGARDRDAAAPAPTPAV